jgi:RNA polymerase sigma factor (sigma-70 family)
VTATEPAPDRRSECADDLASEAALLEAARTGSTRAFGVLYARYRTFAIGIAKRALAPTEVTLAEDVAEVAFVRVLSALRNDKGPTDTLRAYLTTTVRREAWRAQRRHRRQAEVADRWATDADRCTDPDPAPAAGATGALGGHELLDQAFRGLSDRWRHVLWLTEVEGRKPAEVAPLLGLSAGSVSALAYRARGGLLHAYLAAYCRAAPGDACREQADGLGRYLAAGSPAHGFEQVSEHLAHCTSCRELCRGIDVAAG